MAGLQSAPANSTPYSSLSVNTSPLVLSAVVVWRACSCSLVHFPHAPPGRCSPPGSLCGCTVESLFMLCLKFLALFPWTPLLHSPWSMAPHWFSLQLNCREPSHAPPHIPCTCHHHCASLKPPCTSHAFVGLDGPSCQIWRKARMAHHGGRHTNTMGSLGMLRLEADVLLDLTMQQC